MRKRMLAGVALFAAAIAVDGSAGAPISAQRSLASRPRPHAESPIASDGVTVYTVAEDRQTILTINPRRGDWEVLVTLTGAEVLGLAWFRKRLFASDAKGATIHAILTDGKGQQVSVVHRGPPLRKPAEMTILNDLIVADGGAKALFRIAPDVPPTVPQQVLSDIPIHDDTFVAGWGTELLLSDSDSGRIAVMTGLRSARGPRVWGMQQRVEADEPYVERSQDAKSRVPSLTRATSPAVEHPAAMAVYNGIVYVIDSKKSQVFAAATSDARTVRLELPGLGDLQPTRLVATAIELFVLDRKSGRLHRWSRPVPTEIRFNEVPTAVTLAPIFEYLHNRGMLPTRREEFPKDLDELLRSERVSTGVYCSLNPNVCSAGVPRRDASTGAISLPDLYAERAITVTRVTLDGTKSLGEVVDENVIDSRFRTRREEQHLKEINGYKGGDIRASRTGTYRIPMEQVRGLAAFDTRDLKGESPDFKRLTESLRQRARFIPLERVVSTAAAVMSTAVPIHTTRAADQHPNDPDCVKARNAFARLLATIRHVLPPSMDREVSIGIAERKFDAGHRDFLDDANPVFKRDPNDDPCQPGPEDPAPDAPVSPSGEPVVWRKLGRCDHGTAVASLLGARSRPFDAMPLLSNVQLVPIHWEDPRLSQDVDRTMTETPTTVFNLSLKLQGESDYLLQAIETYAELATFVVAAGNDAVQLCKFGGRIYPACWGEHNNVIVVGGTSLDGDSIQPRSNTGRSVHVVAPAADYYSAGVNNSYGLIEGTSFATALVTATAAMLSGMGVERPTLIKQRILATTDVDTRLPDWARRLNVQRAISEINHAVLTRRGRTPMVVTLERPGQDIAFMLDRNGQRFPLTAGQIRRLVRDSRDNTKFLLSYVDAEERLATIRVRAPQSRWPFFYRALGDDGRPAGAELEGDLNEFDDFVGPIGR